VAIPIEPYNIHDYYRDAAWEENGACTRFFGVALIQNAWTMLVTGAFSSRFLAFYSSVGFINRLAQEYPYRLYAV
jgi:hypothetical protein